MFQLWLIEIAHNLLYDGTYIGILLKHCEICNNIVSSDNSQLYIILDQFTLLKQQSA